MRRLIAAAITAATLALTVGACADIPDVPMSCIVHQGPDSAPSAGSTWC